MMSVGKASNGPPHRAVTAGANMKSMQPGDEDCIANEGVIAQINGEILFKLRENEGSKKNTDAAVGPLRKHMKWYSSCS